MFKPVARTALPRQAVQQPQQPSSRGQRPKVMSISAQAVALADGGNLSESRVLALAAALERRANHPIAVAIAAHAEAEGEHAVRMARSSGLQTEEGLAAQGTLAPNEDGSRKSHVSPLKHLPLWSSSGAAALAANDGSVKQEPGSVS